uniref:Uncharacterized protein n=1 Tax=Anopheles epiroticus TaxID=199890 RepID=A0A182PWH8_9DIPT
PCLSDKDNQSINWRHHTKSAVALQVFIADVIKSFVRSERNQQIMCDSGLNEYIVRFCKEALVDEQHPLHLSLQYIFERLAVQALMSKELRNFLRLGLKFSNDNDSDTNADFIPPVPLTRVKTLVSITTPRDFRSQGLSTMPPFIEMDMSTEGFACIFFPNIAPSHLQHQAMTQLPMHSPVITGLSTSGTSITGFGVGSYPGFQTNIIKSYGTGTQIETSVSGGIGSGDRTFPSPSGLTFKNGNVYKDELLTRVWCPTFIRESQWHHVAVTTVRNQTSCFHAIVGTPPIWRNYSRLAWKQGVCHMMDDPLDAAAVARVYMLGPHYLGSFQDVRMEDREDIFPLVLEDKIAFSINPKAYSYMTLNKIRKVYNRMDAKVIGKQLGISSHENATPIIVLHNAAGHLNGPARTLGGVLVGYLGIRKFNPSPVSMTINTVGGCSVLLGLVAMSRDIESLYAAVKALTCILRTSKIARQEMNQRRFYQTLGMLYKRKKTLLNSHILHLTFNLVGTVHSGHESSTIPNITAF